MHASLEHSSMAGALPSDDFGDDLIAEIKHLRAFAVSLSGSASASDVTSSYMAGKRLLRAWSKSTQFRDGTNLRGLKLLTILRNIFYSSLRKRVREVQDSDGVYARCLTVIGRSGRPSRSAGLSQGITGQASRRSNGKS